MKKVLSMVLLAVISFGVTGFVNAADEKPKKKPDAAARFKKMDKDGDGKLSLEEFIGKREGEKKEAAEKVFNRKDKDSDGSLTVEEFSATPKKKKKKTDDN